VGGAVTTVEAVAEAGAPPIEWLSTRWVVKRAFDVVVGVPLCLLAIPLLVALALVLAVQHRASPVFVHQRIGHRGRVVAIPKLRTLPPGTPMYADKTVTDLEPSSVLARFLRVSHLDELPQLFLVPLGRLSLVGPRPRMATEATDHGDPAYDAVRTSVLQGCTGLWQISGHAGRVSDRPEFDHFYVQQHTLRLDAWILWRTLRQVVVPATLDLEDVPAWTLRAPERRLADAV
jgi:lipopolysaccharide/colanic/teichoic acid biosynthesis glycosyltransferase